MRPFDRWLKKNGSGKASSDQDKIALAQPDAERQLEEAMVFEKQGRIDEALRCYDAAIELMPELARAHFNRGNILLDRGDTAQALQAYQQAVNYKPGSAAAHYNMGNAHFQLGNAAAAAAACRHAIALKPDFADAHLTLGMALGKLGQNRDAVPCFLRATEIMPGSAQAHTHLAIAIMEAGRPQEAIASFEAALALQPDDPEAHYQQGIAFQDLGQFEKAVLRYRRALEINSGAANVHVNLGSALHELGRSEEAIGSYERALEIKPDSADAHYNLGVCLQSSGQKERAVACYRSAVEIDAAHVLAHTNLAGLLGALGQYEAALECLRRILQIDPGNLEAHLSLGTMLQTIGQPDSAIASYRKAVAIDPRSANAHVGLGDALKDTGRLDEAMASLRRALELDPGCTIAHNNLLLIHNYQANQPAAVLLADARQFSDMSARLARPYTDWPDSTDPERCLRVGFVSGDLCDHPVGYFLEGVLAALFSQAAGRLELFAYANNASEDATSQRIRACCHQWRPVALLADEALAKLIRDDGIDILIDLSGHTAFNRLPVFAWKPAPVRASWLGYFATTGMAAIDYFIADPWTLPPDQEAYFSEQVWRLPETRLCFTPPAMDLDVGPLPALENGYVTFGCFNNLSKMNDAVVALWAQILNTVPGSRLFLKYQQLGEASVRQRTCERFAAHGIHSGRLIFEGYVLRANYLATYHRVDIALDPFPYPGGTTTVEALWMGIPVLTLAGERFLSRQGVGLLMNAGLPEWVASDPQDYVARAVAHAGDPQALASLRSGLRQKVLASPIFDAPRFAGHFEVALREMWRNWCAKRPVQDESAT